MKRTTPGEDPNQVLIPNSFQVPNIFVDKLLSVLESSDVKIVMFVCRKTYGWQKLKDRISLSQFEKGTGLSRRCLVYRLKILCESGLLSKDQTVAGDVYWLNLAADLDVASIVLTGAMDASEEGGAMDAPVQPSNQGGAMDAPASGAMDAPTETHSLKPTIKTPSSPAASLAETKVDPRWEPIRQDLKTYWDFKNPGVPMPWDGPVDGKALKLFLKSNPLVDRDMWKLCLNNRAKSDIAHADNVHRWIRQLLRFCEGPRDRFDKLIAAGGGTKQQQKEQDIHDTVSNSEKARRAIFGDRGKEIRADRQISRQSGPVLE